MEKISKDKNTRRTDFSIMVLLLSFIVPIFIFSRFTPGIVTTIGVIFMYFIFYLLNEKLIEIFTVERKNNLLLVLLKVFPPFYTLKILERELYKKNIYFIMGILISTVSIIILEYKENRKNYSKEMLKTTQIQSLGVSLIPLYILKTGKNNALLLILVTTLFDFLNKKTEYLDRFRKKEIIFILKIVTLFFITMGLSSLVNTIGDKGIASMKIYFITMGSFFLLMMLNSRSINYKNITLTLFVSSIIFYISSLETIFLNYEDFIRAGRIGGFLDITQTGVLLGFLALTSLYILIYLKIKEMFFFFGINSLLLILTGSKGPLLLTIFFTLLMIIIKLRKNIIKLIIILGIIIGILLNSNLKGLNRLRRDDGSSAARIMLYKEGWRQFKEKPLLGHGQGTYLEVSRDYNKKIIEEIESDVEPSHEKLVKYEALGVLWFTHSNLLELIRGTGIFAGILYYLLILYFAIFMIRLFIKTRDKIYFIGIVSISYFELYGLIDNVIIYERLQLINFTVISLIYHYSKMEEKPKNQNIEGAKN